MTWGKFLKIIIILIILFVVYGSLVLFSDMNGYVIIILMASTILIAKVALFFLKKYEIVDEGMTEAELIFYCICYIIAISFRLWYLFR